MTVGESASGDEALLRAAWQGDEGATANWRRGSRWA
jgi:hypothetical protein